MLEQRAAPRELTLKTGKIVIGNDAAAIDCAILNIGNNGACILVPDATKIPTTFLLELDFSKMVHSCCLVWAKRHRVGVRFLSDNGVNGSLR